MSRKLLCFALLGLVVAGPLRVAAAADDVPAGAWSPEQVAFANDVAQRTFDFFWETTDPEDCLAPDRWPTRTFSSIAATGFALTAYGIGAERGFVSRRDAALRTLQCLETYLAAPQGPAATKVAGFQGFFYHFLDFADGTRHAQVELSSVDSSLLFAGALFAQSYFDRDDPVEQRIRDVADALYRRANWNFFLRGPDDQPPAGPGGPAGIAMGWTPEYGFEPHDWIGYNEGMLVYVLALGSPTHPVGREAWDRGWASGLEQQWATWYGHELLNFAPLFGHQYSHVWIDFRGIQDAFMREKGLDYFENSRRAVWAQYEYAQDNPGNWTGYGGDIWGLTACDGPGDFDAPAAAGSSRQFFGYIARGVDPWQVLDDGTITPTASGSSVAFAPLLSIRALMAMRDTYGPELYSRYGFKDAFNPSFTAPDYDNATGIVVADLGWIARDHVGIDQGPILAMLENQRSELIWRTMRRNPYIRRGLEAIGFTGGWLDDELLTAAADNVAP